MNKKLKLKIIETFGTQADFSMAVGEHESNVTRVIRERRTLSDERKERWAKALNCKSKDIF